MILTMSSVSLPLLLPFSHPWGQCRKPFFFGSSDSLPLLCSRFPHLHISPGRSPEKAFALSPVTQAENFNEEPEEPIRVLTAIRSSYNDIVILDNEKSRMLLLDSSSISSLLLLLLLLRLSNFLAVPRPAL